MTPEEVPANWQDREPGHYDPASDSERGLILSEQGLLDTRRKATEMLTDFYVHDNAKIILVLLDALQAALARHESEDDDEFELESIHHGGNGPEGSR